VPALIYGVGAWRPPPCPASIVVPLAYVVLPRLSETAARHGCMTPADLVRLRTGSGPVALVVALTGVLATMAYVALRLSNRQALLGVLGVPAGGGRSALGLAVVTQTLECLEGNGYVEDSGMPRLYREAPLNSI
jgi:SSS family solute:Na+ symporter